MPDTKEIKVQFLSATELRVYIPIQNMYNVARQGKTKYILFIEHRLNARGRPLLGLQEQSQSPLWRP